MIRQTPPRRPLGAGVEIEIEIEIERYMSWFRRERDDREARFMDAVFTHSDALYRYALRLTGDSDVAADLVQDALTRAYDAFDRLRPDTNHRAWAYTIVRNLYLSRLRRAGREASLDEPDEIVDEGAVGALSALVRRDDGYRHGFEDQVLAALSALPEAQRSAIILCDVEGLRYEDIAGVLGCPVGTVRSRIHHARKRLRLVLSGYARERGYGGTDVAV